MGGGGVQSHGKRSFLDLCFGEKTPKGDIKKQRRRGDKYAGEEKRRNTELRILDEG